MTFHRAVKLEDGVVFEITTRPVDFKVKKNIN